jgi:hypothetical protein
LEGNGRIASAASTAIRTAGSDERAYRTTAHAGGGIAVAASLWRHRERHRRRRRSPARDPRSIRGASCARFAEHS